MATGAPRTGEERKADVLAKLGARHADVWVASAPEAGPAHLVPLSLAWDGEHVIIAIEAASLTARNIVASGRARLALGDTRDVVMVDAVLNRAVGVGEAEPDLADAYAGQADWDPRVSGGGYSFVLLRPHRIQAWRDESEIVDRTVMRDGTWLA